MRVRRRGEHVKLILDDDWDIGASLGRGARHATLLDGGGSGGINVIPLEVGKDLGEKDLEICKGRITGRSTRNGLLGRIEFGAKGGSEGVKRGNTEFVKVGAMAEVGVTVGVKELVCAIGVKEADARE